MESRVADGASSAQRPFLPLSQIPPCASEESADLLQPVFVSS